ncbi:MAG TPA: transporter substrate-binding domain-containing protein [Trueperaceae bacterium]|nr:transporter substrate-binding domain-containing protein [Trueperaceae bacterium]
MTYLRGIPKPLTRILASILLVAAVASVASAQTVDQIEKNGEVTIGVVTGVPPFGSIDPSGATVGYDVDVANLLAENLGVKVKIVPLTPPARIPALLSGKVDILVATLAPTTERAKSVMFTMPYSAFEQVILAPKSDKESGLQDMVGKSIGVPRGSPQDVELTRLAVTGTKIVRFQDDATAAQALFSGQVDAIAIPNITANDILKKRNQESNYEIKFAFSQQPNSIAVRKDAFELHQWLNDFLYNIKLNGKLDGISQKWIGTPLPNLPVF